MFFNFFSVRVCRDLFSYLSRVWDKVLKVICSANEGECCMLISTVLIY